MEPLIQVSILGNLMHRWIDKVVEIANLDLSIFLTSTQHPTPNLSPYVMIMMMYVLR